MQPEPIQAPSFSSKLSEAGMTRLLKSEIENLQINLGRYCNLACVHCHVEAGPNKTSETDNMSESTAGAVVDFMDRFKVKTLDLTGGAPELNPHFRRLVKEATRRRIHTIDRCNLTVLFEPGQEELAEFLAEYQVEIVASLPCYSRENVDKQRGDGTFDRSIQALLLLNRLGYGRKDELPLNLVYNPVGPHLPPGQAELEKDYKERLWEDFGVHFHRLYAITNMPITRYAKYLKAFKQYDDYVHLLAQSFNPKTIDGLMCRNTLNVSWDGTLYDCDFNQMIGMKLMGGKAWNIHDVTAENLKDLPVATADHCFGCTAGSGSSCQGALEN